MIPQRITMITLAVSDLEASRKFYAGLGWVEAEGGNDTIAFYKIAGQFFSLYTRDALAKDIGQSIPEQATGAITLATNYGSRDAVDQAYVVAIAAGARQITKPSEVFWGGYSGNFADPDGHMWEIAHNPFWNFDDNGQIIDDA
ncbi:MAG: glyoxalase [Rhodobacteraceae bacterium]|nr:MAG: glyoxalase [Paracoccaceae bacterium]